MNINTLLWLFIPFVSSLAVDRCGRGDRLQHDICIPCSEEHFMDKLNHRLKDCQPCTVPRPNSHEIVLAGCTRSEDTKIGCEHGYFRQSGGCRRCTGCAAMGRLECGACTGSQDTVCCVRGSSDSTNITKEHYAKGISIAEGNYIDIRYDRSVTTNSTHSKPVILGAPGYIIGYIVSCVLGVIIVVVGIVIYLICRARKRREMSMRSSGTRDQPEESSMIRDT